MDTKQSNKKTLAIFIGGVLVGGLLGLGIALAQQKKQAVDVSVALGNPFIKVDDKVYSTSNLPGDAAMEYYLLQSQIYSAQQNLANQIGLRIALAKDAKKDVDQNKLPKLNEVLSLPTVTDVEAKQYYDNIVAQMGKGVFGGRSFEEVKAQLESRINQQKSNEMVNAKVQELTKAGRVAFLVPQPAAPSVTLDIAGFPTKGNQNSSITLVEVADYLCPHCRETEPVMEKLYNQFKDKVKFVHVSYPLAPTGLSGALARGAFCANQQGSELFWKFHDQAFQVSWEKSQAPVGQDASGYFNSVAISIAQTAGLDSTKFNECLVSTASADYIKKVQDAFNESKGFQGTPAFYINNRLVQATAEQLEPTLRSALSIN